MFKKLKTVVKVYSNAPRYREIFHVFHKYGFGDLIKRFYLQQGWDLPEGGQSSKSVELAREPAERLRMALEELGPTFVKFGQILSTRRDLVDEIWTVELCKLQDQVAPFPGDVAQQMIEKELGRPIQEVFKSFNKEPKASASIAQVHRAVLQNGEIVALKIQRPKIREIINVDLSIMMDIGKFLEKHVEQVAVLDPIGVVKELARTIAAEQDFIHEANNMERFAKQFQSHTTVYVPFVYHDLTTPRLLTMEYVEGYEVDRPDLLRRHHIDPVKVAKNLSKMIYRQMFECGFFHADPHPGNITVLPEGIICPYDYGMMGTLSPDFRQDVANMIIGLSERDHRLVTRALVNMSQEGFAKDVRRLESDVEGFAEEHLDVPLKDLKLGFVLNRLLELLMEHRLRMKSDFYLGIKALTQVEAIGHVLHPELNFLRAGKPYAAHVIERKYDVRRMFKNSYIFVADTLEMLKDLPMDAKDLYEKLRKGNYKVPVEHHIDPAGYEPLRDTLNHSANRLSDSILIASIFIGSSIILLANTPPHWMGIPLFGLIGFLIAGAMGVRLLLSFWKRGGL